MDNYICNGKFQGNFLILGRSFCGKTYFVQKLASNKFWGKLIKAEWVSYICLDQVKEAQIQSCLSSNNNNNLETDYVNNFYGENKKRDRLIVIDNVSGLADG